MTIEENMRRRLFNWGLYGDEIQEVMDRVKAAPEMSGYLQRWNHLAEDYLPGITELAWLSVKRHALAWIDEADPKRWYRPLFVPEGQEVKG